MDTTPLAPDPLERCPIDGVPLVLVTYGGARFGTGVVMLGCPLCNKVVSYQETGPPSEILESGSRSPPRPLTSIGFLGKEGEKEAARRLELL